jgi:hypothetical protein
LTFRISKINMHIIWYLCVLLGTCMYSVLHWIMFCMLLSYWFDCSLCIVFLYEESVSVCLTWPIAQWLSLLILFCVCHVVHDFMINSKGRDSETSWYSCKSASFIFLFFFVVILKQSYVFVWAVFVFWLGHFFFTNPTDVLHVLVAWKFILSFDGLSGYEKGKLLARVTMTVLRLVHMIAYLKDRGLYWVFNVSV